MRHIFSAFAAVLLLAGCTTQQVDLSYSGGQSTTADSAALDSVQMGKVVDERGHGTNWLGAIRGGFGQPIKTLETDGPVKGVVRKAYADALKARGLYTENGQAPRLRVVMEQFDCNQYVRREAHIKFSIQLVGADAGALVYEDRVEVDRVEGSLVSLDTGIFADVEDLRKVALKTLQRAIDQSLDDPEFRRALRRTEGGAV